VSDLSLGRAALTEMDKRESAILIRKRGELLCGWGASKETPGNIFEEGVVYALV
jgi:hypothetical protein